MRHIRMSLRTATALAVAVLALAPHAGSQTSPTAVELVAATSAVVSSATTQVANSYRVADGNAATFWQSGACNPSGWLPSPQFNFLLGACEAGLCSSSAPVTDGHISRITDGNMAYTNAWFTPLQSMSTTWLRILVPGGPQALRKLKLRGRFYSNTTITAITANR